MRDNSCILLIEDDVLLNQINRLALEADGYTVYAAHDLVQARTLMDKHIPDLIVLDVKLPDGTGFEFCRGIRKQAQYASIPVLFLTSVTDNAGELEGLRAGGNDYLRKPYGIELLRIRVRNLLMLRESQNLRDISAGSLTLKVKAAVAYLHGENMGLMPKEFALLLVLIENEGHVLSSDYIYETAWEAPFNDNKSALKFQISSLRNKLEGSGYTITTVYGKGYRFEERY